MHRMSDYEREKLDVELKQFTSRNFERPSHCRNGEQIRFYIQELCLKIEEYKNRFNYVPAWAYGLLAQYNERQHDMVYVEFKS
jgi:hypothetical protein